MAQYDCGDCRAISYCSPEHAQLDESSHKEACSNIYESSQRVEILRQQLVSRIPSPFRHNIGQFWAMPETSVYLQEMSNLVELLGSIIHRTAVERRLVYAFHVMYFGGSDRQSFRFRVPALMMRINRDQECYDFMKWRSNNHNRDRLSQMSLETMRVRFANPIITGPRIISQDNFVGYIDEDILEPIEEFDRETSIMTLIPLCLVKIRFLFEVQRMELAVQAFGSRFPNEVLDMIVKNVPTTKKIAQNQQLVENPFVRLGAMETLMGQILQLYNKIHSLNPYVWKGMVWAKRGDARRGEMDPQWLAWDMETYVKNNWESWIETPGAISLLKRIMSETGNT
jgi:hypothetical protein